MPRAFRHPTRAAQHFSRRAAADVAPGLEAVPVDPMRVLALFRDAVQQGVEPLPEGGLPSLTARPSGAAVRSA